MGILDTGPLVALLDSSDQHHSWAVEQTKSFEGPLMTCEPVLAEAFFLLRQLRSGQEMILQWLEQGALRCSFSVHQEVNPLRELWKKYRDVPMSLADACLVRMSETHRQAVVLTLDSDFVVYRKNKKDRIPFLHPDY